MPWLQVASKIPSKSSKISLFCSFVVRICIKVKFEDFSHGTWTHTSSLSRQNRTAATFIAYEFEVRTVNHHSSAKQESKLAKVLIEVTQNLQGRRVFFKLRKNILKTYGRHLGRHFFPSHNNFTRKAHNTQQILDDEVVYACERVTTINAWSRHRLIEKFKCAWWEMCAEQCGWKVFAKFMAQSSNFTCQWRLNYWQLLSLLPQSTNWLAWACVDYQIKTIIGVKCAASFTV